MKNRLLSLLAAGCTILSVQAQTWTAPVEPTVDSDPVSGHIYKVKNVQAYEQNGEAGFLAGGTSWYDWATSTVVTTSENALSFTLTQTDDGWTFARTSDGKYTFLSGQNPKNQTGLGEMHVDMNSQGHNYFEIIKQDNGNYHICAVASDDTYGATMEGYATKCWGWYLDVDNSTYPTAIYGTVSPEDGYGCDWQFIDLTIYYARLYLYNALVDCETNYSTVDYTAEAAVYQNEASTLDELNAATTSLNDKITNAKIFTLLNGASEDDPKDATSLLINPDFELLNISGWDNGFVSGTNATNVGYQSASYTNTSYTYTNHNNEEVNPNCIHFIEAWAANGTKFGSYTYSTIGDAQLSQTIESLPAGKYSFTCDAIAAQQYDASVSVTGVQLFAVGGDVTVSSEIATGGGVPEHVSLTFYSTGGDVTLGLRTVSSKANWIAADNFELVYYGEVAVDPNKLVLDDYIVECETTYPDLDEVKANADVKRAYEQTLDASKKVTENYTEQLDILKEAVANLKSSINEYASVATSLNSIDSYLSVCETYEWDGLQEKLSDYRDSLKDAYDEGTLTAEEIAAIDDKLSKMIADYVSENAKAGDDVTILLKNPGFDSDFSSWTVDEDGATPAWGGMNVENDNGTGAKLTDLNSGNAEVYHAAFDISQTIKNMPAGLYTLSCQAFERDDSGTGIEAELYAVLPDGSEQTTKIKNLYDETSEDILYQNGTSSWDTSLAYGEGYVPNTMCGANVYFAAGYYKNSFSIVMTAAGDVTVGIRTKSTGDWVLFDDFKLVYEGSGASVYADLINELIAKANAVGDNGTLTAEADTKIAKAINAAEDAMEANDEEACIASITGLNEAIEFGNNTIALVESLQTLYDITNELRMVSVESSDEALPTLVEEVGAALEDGEFETNAQVEKYIADLKRGFTVYATVDIVDGASEENPADITTVILTPSGVDNNGNGSTYGWTINGGSVGLGEGATEIFNQGNVEFTQNIDGLPTGFYRMSVNGYYRAHAWAATTDANDVDTLAYNVTVFAGDVEIPLRSVKSDASAYNDLVGGTTENAWAIPVNMAQAVNAFDNDLYLNTLEFEVKEGQETVTIGLRKGDVITDDWTIFDNWKLEYLGTSAPTAVTSVQSSAVAGMVIYNVNGMRQSRLTKGVNIVKTTATDGTVRVSKVLVR